MSGLLASAIVIPSSTESMAWSFSLRSSRAARGTSAVGWSSSSWDEEAAAAAEAAEAESAADPAAAADAAVLRSTGKGGGGCGESGGWAAEAVAVIISEERRIPWSSASRAATRARSREASSSGRGWFFS